MVCQRRLCQRHCTSITILEMGVPALLNNVPSLNSRGALEPLEVSEDILSLLRESRDDNKERREVSPSR